MSKKQAKDAPKKLLTVEDVDKFVFYDSYLKQISKIKNPTMRLQLYDNIAFFGCKNVKPSFKDDDTGAIEAISERIIEAIQRDKELYVAKSNGGRADKVNNPDGNNQHTTEPQPMTPQDALNFVCYFIDDYLKDTKFQGNLAERNGIGVQAVNAFVMELLLDWTVNTSMEDARQLLTPQKIFTKQHLRNALSKYIDREIETARKADKYASKGKLLGMVVRDAPRRTPQEVVTLLQHEYTAIQQDQDTATN